MNVKLFIYFLIVLFVTQNSQSQVVKSKPIDSTKVMYQKIEQNLKKSKFKKFLHKLIFTSTSRRKPSKNDFRDNDSCKVTYTPTTLVFQNHAVDKITD